jgi:hypothetical protein
LSDFWTKGQSIAPLSCAAKKIRQIAIATS